MDKPDPFEEWLASITGLLRSYRNHVSATTTHRGMAGEAREFFVREVLARFLPDLEVGTGQILSVSRNTSKQVDVVLSRRSYPVLATLAHSNVYLIESVLATIEVKSRLTGGANGTLWKALDNCRSVKQCLDLDVEEEYSDVKSRVPGTYIFGFAGYTSNIEALRGTLNDWVEERGPCFLDLPEVIVSEGVVLVKNDSKLSNWNKLRIQQSGPIYLAARATDGIFWLFDHLLGQIAWSDGRPGNEWRSYVRRRNHDKRRSFEDSSERWGLWSQETYLDAVTELLPWCAYPKP